ncbi:MAG: alkaline phosphatase, partial [Bacteroidetes bacterium HGW-Bacteroidetes-22]
FAATFAKNRYITCSAAAGTALATGEKTSINTIGMDSARTHPLRTIAERARAKGMKVGIMTTVSIDHATPACFYAHQPDRNMYYEIGTQLLSSGFDFFGGGGFKYPTGKNKDQPDLYQAVAAKGYTIVKEQKVFDTVSVRSLPMMVVNPVLSASSDMPYAMDSVSGSFSLSGIVKKAIEVLDNPKGFFMMVEGGKIDWAAHANDAAAIIGEVLELDKAIGYALEFYRQHPDETLIIVTADHETGGLALGWAGTQYESDFTLLDRQKVSSDLFDAKMKAYKKRTPASMVRFDSVMRMVATDFGLGADIRLSKCEEEQLRRAFRISMSGEKESLCKDENTVLFDIYEPIGVTARRI